MLIHKTGNRMRKQLVIIGLRLICGMSLAQNETDAFRYSQYSPTGTARYSSLSGAIGAFGADFTGLSANNPAGLGVYKKSEITFTFAVPYNKITSTYNGEQSSEVKYGFTFNNLGFVFSFSNSDPKWKKVQFATGLNNLARYKGISFVSGPNIGGEQGTTNFFDYVAESSNGKIPDLLQGIEGGAYDFYLTDLKQGETDQYYSMVGAQFYQQEIIKTDGYLNEYIFSLGSNYDDKIFLGATIGIPFFSYVQEATYTESRNGFYDTLIAYNRFTSRATGVNLKLGIIYQPAKFIRVGAAVHTPTFYPNVKERYENYIDIPVVYYDTIIYRPPLYEGQGSFNYQLVTPYHAIANVAFIFKNIGFLNIDYDFTDYSTSRMPAVSSYSFKNENKAIGEHYQGVHTIRAGGEVNISSHVSLRLGYSYSTNPYKKLAKDGTYQTFSGGIGYKSKIFFADFAYMYKYFNDKEVFYNYNAESLYPYTSRIVNQVFALTFGFKM